MPCHGMLASRHGWACNQHCLHVIDRRLCRAHACQGGQADGAGQVRPPRHATRPFGHAIMVIDRQSCRLPLSMARKMLKLWCCLLQVLRSALAGPTLPLVPQGLFLQTAANACGAGTHSFGHLFWNCPQMPSPEKRTAHLPAAAREWPPWMCLAQLSALASPDCSAWFVQH